MNIGLELGDLHADLSRRTLCHDCTDPFILVILAKYHTQVHLNVLWGVSPILICVRPYFLLGEYG